MISSRWPRPIGISASIALMPVWTGVSTDWRTMTPGAIRSTGRRAVVAIGPLSSSGRPSGSTTRPRSAWPTGTSATRPVVLTVSPSLIASALPRMRVSTPASNWSIADFRMLVISSERMAMGTVLLQGARCELVPQPLEAASDAPVDESIADPDDDPAEDRRVDVGFECDAAAGERFEAGRDLADLVVGQRCRARGGGVGQPVALVVEAGKLGRDAWQLLDPSTPDKEQDEVADGLAQVGEDALR